MVGRKGEQQFEMTFTLALLRLDGTPDETITSLKIFTVGDKAEFTWKAR
jgi:hypothetical protein